MFTAKSQKEKVFLVFLTLMLATSETIIVAILLRNCMVTQLQIVLDMTGWII